MSKPSISSQVGNAAFVTELIGDTLMAIKLVMAARMTSLSRNASGDSVRSLKIETTGVDGILWGKRSFRYMEQGRGGGGVPYNFRDIILRWILDKSSAGGFWIGEDRKPPVTASDYKSIAWFISRKIKKEGTKLHREKRTDDIFTSIVEQKIDELGGKIMIHTSSDIDRITDIL
ncbi:MAG: hypothetical protein ACI4SO_05110 [Muribaculaceae bacterium]